MAFHGLLLSSGFSSDSLREKVAGIAGSRGYAEARVVTTAHPGKERAPMAALTKSQLEDMGMRVTHVDFDRGESLDDSPDLVYVCGGNTFHLSRSIQTSAVPIKRQIAGVCARGGLYIGSSAGAVLASPSIASAGEVGSDRNADGVTDLTAFGFVRHHIIPHYRPSMDAAIRRFCEKHQIHSDDVLLLRDGSGLYVDTFSQVYCVVWKMKNPPTLW